jgi:hypothetical protein
MPVRITKPEINVREKLSEIPRNLGNMAYRSANSTMNYQLIETRVLETAGNTLSFPDVFTNKYSSFKLVVHWLGVVAGSDAREVYLRYLDGAGAQITANNYQNTFNFEGSGGTNIDAGDAPGVEGKLWEDTWSNISGGIHGEINFYNVSAPVVKGISTDRGAYYRPYCRGEFLGYDDGNLYGTAVSSIRYNNDLTAANCGGFQLYQSSNADFRAQTYMSLYGLAVEQ